MFRLVGGRADRKCKYVVVFEGEKIRIGQWGAKDFTLGATKDQKEAYLKRHEKREDWDDPSTSGYWARWLLWDTPSFRKNVKRQRDKGLVFKVQKCKR